ncbi:MAG: hypothetical protein BGO29_08405 [Bacteroidales bacterium 36-12]|nr:MAG: hypothetical protein BGO29_08405 [Bacteroidales bacterium 36-12]
MGQKYKFVSVLSLLTLIVIMLDTYFAFLFSRLDKPQQTEYLNNLTSPQNYPPDMQLINTLFVIVMTVYFIVALFRIIKHKRLAQDFYSNIEVIKIRYTRNFIILVTALNTMLAVVYTLFPAPIVEYFYIPLISNIIYIFIVYYAFSQSAVLDKTEYCTIIKEASDLERFKEMKEPLCKEIEELKKQENTKDKKWKLTEIEIDYNYKKILDYMKNKKPYLDSNLNLTKFSSALSACSHNISLTLNVRFKQNFFDFINSYRVEEAKQMLKNNNINFITVEAIGFDAGFNSKTAFYRAFKKHTGQTPMEYVSSQNLNKDYA